jgi:hypothetical protein
VANGPTGVPTTVLPFVAFSSLPVTTSTGCPILHSMQQDVGNGTTPGKALLKNIFDSLSIQSTMLGAINSSLVGSSAASGASSSSAAGSGVPPFVLLGSPDFYTSTGGSDQAWFNDSYQILLGRQPGQSDTIPSGGLSDPSARMSLIQGIVSGSEFQTDAMQGIYQQFLHRAATSSEVTQDLQTLSQGGNIGDLIGQIVEQNAPQGQSSSSFANDLFKDWSGIDSGQCT